MITLIWYAPHNAFYVTLTPTSGEEQTLVDTLFPQVRSNNYFLILSGLSVLAHSGETH